MDNLNFCCSLISSNQKANGIASKLQTNPVHIFWWHKCNENVKASSRKDLSPFPREWSVNYGRNREGSTNEGNLLHSLTDDSSVYSTLTQENRANRNEFGFCRVHPQIQLAKKKQTNRFSKIFSNASQRGEEWLIIRQKCPECEKKPREENSAKRQATIDADRMSITSESLNMALYNPIPASLTLVLSHPGLEGKSALKVRTEPIPIETIQTISCQTPDGVLDIAIPCDSNGKLLDTEYSDYQIIERYIPLSSIDHVSRGGDAWDVLRQSTGEDDLGCQCDVKVHGFSDRLLRFDVINFDAGETVTKTKRDIRYSFAFPDFMKKSSSASSKNLRTDSMLNQQETFSWGNYSSESVISDLSYLVMVDREQRNSGIEYLVNNASSWMDAVCGVGPATSGKDAPT